MLQQLQIRSITSPCNGKDEVYKSYTRLPRLREADSGYAKECGRLQILIFELSIVSNRTFEVRLELSHCNYDTNTAV